MAKKMKKGVYYLSMKRGPRDAMIHNPALIAGDMRFVESQAGKEAIHRLMTKFGLTETEAVNLIK